MSADILLIDDEVNMLRTLGKILERKGYSVRTAESGVAGLALMDDALPDLLITDMKMPEMTGGDLLRAAKEKLPSLPVIVLTGHGTIESAVAAMKQGAFDYLLKPCDADELLLTIARALEIKSLQSEVKQLRRQVEKIRGYAGIVGDSPAMKEVFATIQAVAAKRTTVLLTGESGTGKELVARAIHENDPARRERPFIAVNCGALSPNLLESQLFGHRKGAFTGAVADHEGLFQACSGGTVFLDEISEMSKELQVKFLRVLEEREVTPLGTNKPIKVDVRIIAATNHNLEECVRKGSFRDDLYFRLSVVVVTLPPLRTRPDDLPLLVQHFVKVFSDEYGIAPKPVDPEVLERFRACAWPGNVRELRNVIERAFALSDEPRIGVTHLPRSFGRAVSLVADSTDGALAATTAAAIVAPGAAPAAAPIDDLSLESLERRQIEEALRRSHGSKSEASKLLGINRKRLYRKIKKFGL